MATTTMTTQVGPFDAGAERAGFSWFERMVLRRTHPISIFLETTGLTWSVYFLWQHNWIAALASVLVARLVALTVLRNINLKAMADTTLGKIGLLHLQPVNVVVQLLAVVGLIWGLWSHETAILLVAVSVLLLGHLCGWSKVDARFSIRD